MLDNITVFHSSIKIVGDKNVYFDPYKVQEESHDADIVFITHDHFDHYSIEDINKIINEKTIIVAPESMKEQVDSQYSNLKLFVAPNMKSNFISFGMPYISFETIPAYNILKPFHPKKNNWLGYIVTINGMSYYVAGDTDKTKEAKQVKCDVALIPCGGTYTMNYKEAAELANEIKPKYAVPTHYGSVAGSMEDGERFIKLLDSTIQGIIKIK